MGIEVATFISELVAANPTGADDYATADDHLRLIKSVLQSQFPNFTAAPVNPDIADMNVLVGVGDGIFKLPADIVTATPPVAEAVTAQYKFFDSDLSDELGFFGYLGSNSLRIINRMHGGAIAITGEDTGGVERTILSADPDALTILRADTDLHLQTGAGTDALVLDSNQDAVFSGDVVVTGTTNLQGNISNSAGNVIIDDALVVTGNMDVQGFIFDSLGNLTLADAVDIISTLDVTDALTALSYGGITEANLVDKTAVEVITNNWRYSEVTRTPLVVGDSDTSLSQPFGASSTSDRQIMVRSATAGHQVGYQAQVNDGTRDVRVFFGLHDNDVWGLTASGNLNPPTFVIESAAERHFAATKNAEASLYYNGAQTARTLTAANGGLEANNTLTGGGFERVLTTSDIVVVRKVKTADKPLSNNIVREDDNHLLGWNLVTGARYSIEGYIIYTQNIGNIQMQFQFTNTPQSGAGAITWMAVDTGGGTAHDHSSTAIGVFAVTTLTDGAENGIYIRGVFQANATTGGTLDFQWAQETSDANATVVREGSWIKVTKLD